MMEQYTRDTEYQSLRRLLRPGRKPSMAELVGEALVQELTPRQAEMVQMYYLEQHTMQDIAQILGINVSTVSRTLKSARGRLHRCLRYTSSALLREE